MKKLCGILAGALCLYVGSPSGSGADPLPDPDQPRIGVILPLSGELIRFGEKVRQGIELAAEDEGAGGMLIFEDGEATKNKALTAFHKLTAQDQVKYIIGPIGPDQTLAVAPAAKRKGILLVSVSLCEDRFKAEDHIFCIYPSQREQLKPLTDLFREDTKKVSRVALMFEELEAADACRDEIGKFAQGVGATVVADRSFPGDAMDFRADLLRIKSTNPDLLAVGSASPARTISIFKQAQEIGLKVPARWYLSEQDERIFKDNQAVLEGVFTGGVSALDPKFTKKFEARFGYKPDLYHGLGYDAARALIRATANPARDYKEAADRLIQHPLKDTATEGFAFNLQRAVELRMKPSVIKNGQQIVLSNPEGNQSQSQH